MTRLQAFLLVFLFWAGIYLPGLGSSELKGEEGRRILPAITMLETGQWLVPYVGGKPFLRKPPLINWIIAGSFRATGLRNEWTARLPTALAMLALVAVLIGTARGGAWLKPETALVAAVITLTQAASLDKGRLAEIEGIYTALSGIAMLLWLAWWSERRSPWLLWTVPWLFLGLGLLAKAPLHLLFFYAIVFAVLWQARELRQLFHPAHLAGLGLMCAIFGAWFFPYIRTEAAVKTAEVWQGQFTGRVTGHFDWAGWVTEIPRGLLDRLPWLLFTPLLWRRDLPALGERTGALFRGARLGVLATFFGLLLLPGLLPRYTLPLTAPFACLLATVLADDRLPPPVAFLRAWWHGNRLLAGLLVLCAVAAPVSRAVLTRNPAWLPAPETALPAAVWSLAAAALAGAIGLTVLLRPLKFARPALIAAVSAALVGAFMLLRASVLTPLLARKEHVRPLGQAISQAVPAGETLYLYDPEYQPAIFYLTVPYTYAPAVKDVPASARWVLTRSERAKDLLHHSSWQIERPFPENQPAQLQLLRRSE